MWRPPDQYKLNTHSPFSSDWVFTISWQKYLVLYRQEVHSTVCYVALCQCTVGLLEFCCRWWQLWGIFTERLCGAGSAEVADNSGGGVPSLQVTLFTWHSFDPVLLHKTSISAGLTALNITRWFWPPDFHVRVNSSTAEGHLNGMLWNVPVTFRNATATVLRSGVLVKDPPTGTTRLLGNREALITATVWSVERNPGSVCVCKCTFTSPRTQQKE